MIVEYLLVYNRSGTPIISQCFAGFCTKLVGDPQVLDKTVMKLSTVPQILAKGSTEATKYSMGSIEFYFYTVGDYIIVLGQSDGTGNIEDISPTVINGIEEIVNESNDEREIFQKINNKIEHWDHIFKERSCPAEGDCPITFGNEAEPIWDKIAGNYDPENLNV